jgi:hypothetical protein
MRSFQSGGIKGVEGEVYAEFPCGGLENALALGHDFLAYAVAGDDGDCVFCHVSLSGK